MARAIHGIGMDLDSSSAGGLGSVMVVGARVGEFRNGRVILTTPSVAGDNARSGAVSTWTLTTLAPTATGSSTSSTAGSPSRRTPRRVVPFNDPRSPTEYWSAAF